MEIKLEEKYLIVNNRHVEWSQIVGIRSFHSELMIQLSSRGPFSEILLHGGKTLLIKGMANIIYTEIEIDDSCLKKFNVRNRDRYEDYFRAICAIEERSKFLKPDLARWIEWRFLVIPSAFYFVFVLSSFFIFDTIAGIVIFSLIGFFIGSLFGLLWEYLARNRFWRKDFKKST